MPAALRAFTWNTLPYYKQDSGNNGVIRRSRSHRMVSELAAKVKQERAFLFRALSLVNLAPDIIEAILNGKEPATLTLSILRKGIPEDWIEQRKMFGME